MSEHIGASDADAEPVIGVDVPVIAVDGPSGSGKGTLSARIAQALQWHLLDSGALYRIIAVVCEQRGVEPAKVGEAQVAELALSLDIAFRDGEVLVDGVDLAGTIRTEDAGVAASVVAAMPAVRAAMFDLQRQFARAPGLVADGRDMGTVVFPHAPLKVFLDASAEERAQRRYKQLKNKGLSVSLPGLLEQIKERDARDRGRTISPLKAAGDALLIDSTSLSIDAVFEQVMQEVATRGLG